MGKICKLFKNPDRAIGRLIHFVDRIDCCDCERMDDLEMCQDYGDWKGCQLKLVTTCVTSVSYYRVNGTLYCRINEKYEIPVDQLGRVIYLERYDAWLYLERIKRRRARWSRDS